MTIFAGAGRRSLLLLSLSGIASTAQAQVPPSAQVTPPTREEIERVPTAPVAPPPSRLRVEGDVERAPCPLADPRFADVTVTISEVVFDKLKVVSPDLLRPAYAPYLGKTVPIAAVCEIRDAAATILRREGYLAAVQVPPQRINNGVVHFDVLMAKLVAVRVRGDAGRSERLIAGYLNKLTGDEVFNQKEAERYLLLARDLPGYDVRMTLRPAGTVPGEVIGEVSVVKVPFTIDTNVQNLGSNDVGRWGGLIRGEFHDILGGDRLTVGLFNTAQRREQTVVQAGYDIALGSEGLTLGGRFTLANTTPDLGPRKQDDFVHSTTLLASLEAAYPFVRTQSANLRGALGFDFINQKVRALGALQNLDRIRILYARADFDMINRASISNTHGYSLNEPRWRLAGSLELRKGVSILDASEECETAICALPTLSRLEAEPTAALVRFSGVAEYRPSPGFALALSPRAQYSRDKLVSYEEYSAGNYTVGRGYDPGTIIGDSGVGFQAEIRAGSLSPKSQTSFAFQPYVFLDQAWVWNNDAQRNYPNGESLTSAGVGVRAAYGAHGRLDVALAKPLRAAGLPAVGQTEPRKGDVRLLVSLTTRLVPW